VGYITKQSYELRVGVMPGGDARNRQPNSSIHTLAQGAAFGPLHHTPAFCLCHHPAFPSFKYVPIAIDRSGFLPSKPQLGLVLIFLGLIAH
jgi:hypothetical protein